MGVGRGFSPDRQGGVGRGLSPGRQATFNAVARRNQTASANAAAIRRISSGHFWRHRRLADTPVSSTAGRWAGPPRPCSSAASALSSRAIRPFYQGWMVVAFPIGWTVSKIVLGASCICVHPLALVFRLMGRDALKMSCGGRRANLLGGEAAATSGEEYLRQC